MITIILQEPEHPGNLGAIARSMKNFEFEKLVIVNPKFEIDCPETRNRAKHANDIIDKAEIVNNLDIILDKLDYKIATTSKLGTDYNLLRTPLTPKELAVKISEIDDKKVNIGIIFGRESSGLTNEEIKKMDFVINIPTGKYSALNLSHAVSTILYEIFQQKNENKKNETYKPISNKEMDVISNIVDDIISKQNYLNDNKRNTQKIIWKHIIKKSMLTKREAFALIGFFRKCQEDQQKIENLNKKLKR
jgi:tRNA/rRNA methyltransferase